MCYPKNKNIGGVFMANIVEKRQERISKMQEKVNKMKKEIEREQSALKTAARKADTRDKIELGGLLRIAFETSGGRPEDLDAVLGAMMESIKIINNNTDIETIKRWNTAGAAERIRRNDAKNAARKPAQI